MENKFYKVMNAHSDEELIQVYKNQADYTDEAIEAMKFILLERNLLKEGTQAFNTKKEDEALSREELYNNFQRSEFGKVVSDFDFAQESLKDAIYFQRYISPIHNYNWLNHVFIIFGIVSTVLCIAVIGIGEFRLPFNIILVLSILGALLLPLGIWKLSKNKAQINIIKLKNRNVLTIQGAKDAHELPLPFRYECYWEWHYIKLTLRQVKLSVFLFDVTNNTVIELRELLELHKSPPFNWEKLPKDISSHTKGKSFYAFLNHATQKPFLVEFQKVLNGLHSKS